MRVKRQEVYDAILAAAEIEFSNNGYVKSTIARIARRAQTSPANVYVYFSSKLEIVMAVYEPWLKAHIEDIEKRTLKERDPVCQLEILLKGLFMDMPGNRAELTTSLLQALSTAERDDKYNPSLLRWTENKLASILSRIFKDVDGIDNTPMEPIAGTLMLVFDGVGIRSNLGMGKEKNIALVNELTALIYARVTNQIPDRELKKQRA